MFFHKKKDNLFQENTQNFSFPDPNLRPWYFWTFFMVHFFFAFLIQWENLLGYLSYTFDHVREGILVALRIPFFQGEILLVSIILAAFASLLPSNKWGKSLFFLYLLASLVFLLFDQIMFKLFFTHMNFSFSDDPMGLTSIYLLLGSTLAEMDFITYINLFLLIFLLYYFSSHEEQILQWTQKISHKKRLIPILLFLLFIYLPLNLYCSHFENYLLPRHPLTFLAESYLKNQKPLQAPKFKKVEDLYSLRHGEIRWNPAKEEAIYHQGLAIQKRKRKPNIIFIVIESVGSLQIMPRGKLSSKRTPHLSQLARHGIFFPEIYTVFPGTIRSHIPMMTGGRLVTWTSVYEDCNYPYIGPNLISLLKKSGYRTALFSAQILGHEGMDRFYKNFPYDKIFDYIDAPKDFQNKYTIHSWGGMEGPVMDLALQWVKKEAKKKLPFFLHFFTVSNHHPYGVPDGYKSPFPTNTNKGRYYAGLHYIDSVIGKTVEKLKKWGLLENTLLLITGDHGQAFGERHPKNYTHKHFLYEENIKTFWMIFDFKILQKGPFYSERIGFVGDFLPTINFLLGGSSLDVPGTNLFTPKPKKRIIYFHKSAIPEKWGLRDGGWKFIIEATQKHPELYYLPNDPKEQRNLAKDHPQWIQEYYNLCANWIAKGSPEYRKYLKGFQQYGKDLRPEDLIFPGPKDISIGYYPTQKDMENFAHFKALNEVHPLQKIGIFGRWQPYHNRQFFKYDVESPKGKHYWFDMIMERGWAITWYPLDLPRPLEKGKWKVRIWKDGKVLLEKDFWVSPQAPLLLPVKRQ
ncbi:MAG: DUF229 domain-containing protein [Planctomycetota bacterium]|nr:MAG: DUF229 domain-containing protein [Planctomycetota bacterium]